LLVVGQNTMAVMVKKNAALGPSLYFDVEVTGHRDAEDGCGCTATERSGSPGWLIVVLIALRRRR
ncbi:MAG: MYXO-CTERM sorting domain-containing protein, partial [Deltaproteobacteria bacterium]